MIEQCQINSGKNLSYTENIHMPLVCSFEWCGVTEVYNLNHFDEFNSDIAEVHLSVMD